MRIDQKMEATDTELLERAKSMSTTSSARTCQLNHLSSFVPPRKKKKTSQYEIYFGLACAYFSKTSLKDIKLYHVSHVSLSLAHTRNLSSSVPLFKFAFLLGMICARLQDNFNRKKIFPSINIKLYVFKFSFKPDLGKI